MKRNILLLLMTLTIGSCIKDTGEGEAELEKDSRYYPVLMTRTELEKSIKFLDSRKLEKPGKLYRIGDYLFINEKYKGVHVIDNSDPSTPVKKGFIQVPGCIDMAVKDTVLYVDNAVDLVAIDISNPEQLVVTKRIAEMFLEHYPPGYDYVPYPYSKGDRPANTIIVEWTQGNK